MQHSDILGLFLRCPKGMGSFVSQRDMYDLVMYTFGIQKSFSGEE
jgi:hypothetical protein